MDRGENLFAQNWVEQWKRNVREHGLEYHRSINTPTLAVAEEFYCDVFSWGSPITPEPFSVWDRRMIEEWPDWVEEI